MTISNAALLVEMNISVWTASRVDKTATDKITNDASADPRAAQVRKNLMAGTSLRKEIADYAASCRLWHNLRTLPWADKGARLMPTSLFLDYKSEANVRRDTFNGLVTEFLTQYPDLVTQAATHMGGLFDVADYPSVEDVASKFGFRLVFSPVPEAGDFRLDLPRQDMEDMKQEYEVAFERRVADAMREPWERLHELLTGMSAKLTDGGDEKKRYHDTLVTNAQSFCSLLTHLNVTGDPLLEKARRDLEGVMLGKDIEDIRDSAAVRSEVKGRIDKMLSQYEW